MLDCSATCDSAMRHRTIQGGKRRGSIPAGLEQVTNRPLGQKKKNPAGRFPTCGANFSSTDVRHLVIELYQATAPATGCQLPAPAFVVDAMGAPSELARFVLPRRCAYS